MAINVACEACGTRYRVGDHRAGQRIPCRRCGADMQVCGSDSSAAGLRRSSRRRRDRRTPLEHFEDEAAHAGSAGPAWWIIASVVAASVALGVILVVTMAGRRDVTRDEAAPRSFADQASGLDAPESLGRNRVDQVASDEPGGASVWKQADDAERPARINEAAGNRNQARMAEFGDQVPADAQPFKTSHLPEQQPEHWTAQPDPPAATYQFDQNGRLEIALEDGQDVVFPTGYGPFVAIERLRNRPMEVWDLQDRSRIGRLADVPTAVMEAAISSDGTYFAAADGRHVLVWDVRRSKGLLKLRPPDDGFYNLIEFAGSRRILVARGDGAITVFVWTLPEGESERPLRLPDEPDSDSLSTSPGGRYLAAYVGQDSETRHLRLYDLETSEVAGRVPAPPGPSGPCRGLAFACDGSELAGLFGNGSEWEIWIWSMSDGRMIERISLNDASIRRWNAIQRILPLQWFPGGQRWLLYGGTIVDRASGKVILQLPETSETPRPRQVLDDRRLVTHVVQPERRVVETFEVDEELLARGEAILEQGGQAIDAALPPLSSSRFAEASLVGNDGAVEWAVRPDPAPAASVPPRADPLQVGAEDAEITGFWLGDPASSRAGIFYEARDYGSKPRESSRRGPPASPVWLKVFDLKSDRVAGRLEIPFRCDFLAMSPSGRRAVFALPETADRLDVYSIDDQAHVLGFRPFQTDGTEISPKVTAAVFLDDDLLFTMNEDYRLVLWNLATGEPVYQIEQAMTRNQSPPVLSAGQRTLAVFREDECRLHDSRSGQPRGVLNFDGEVPGAGFSPDGRRLVAVASSRRATRMHVWDVATGQPEKVFALPDAMWFGESRLHFCGSDRVLYGTPQEWRLIDLAHERFLWSYRPVYRGQHWPFSLDGGHWLLAEASVGRDKGVYLARLELPGSQEQYRLDMAELRPRLAFRAGSTVSLEMLLPEQAPGYLDFPAAVRANLTRRLGGHGIAVAPGAPTVFHVSLTEHSTGKSHQFEPWGPGGRVVRVPEHIFQCKVVVTHEGRPVWEKVREYNNEAYAIFADATSVEAELRERQWESATTWLVEFDPPPHAFADDSGNPLGTGRLSIHGVEDVRLGADRPQSAPRPASTTRRPAPTAQPIPEF